jgi:hypothetical protein
MTSFLRDLDEVTLIRALCAVLAAVIVIDAISVGAGGLAIVAVPFIAGAVFFRQGRMPATVLLALCGAAFAVIGINYAVGNGFDAGWGDLLFAYLGTPVALAIIGFDVHRRMHESHVTA